MKIIYLLNQRFPTIKAYGLQVAKTCEALQQNGVSVELVVPRRDDQPEIRGKSSFELYGVKHRFAVSYLPALDFAGSGINSDFAFKFQQTISAVIASLYLIDKEGVVYSRDQFTLYFLSLFSSRKLFWEAHRLPNLHSRFYRRLRHRLTGLVTITAGLKQEFVRAGWPAEKILVSPDGVALEDFQIGETQESVRQELGLPLDKKVAMYVGHLFEWKGADIFAESAQFLGSDTLVVIGGGTKDDVERFKSAGYSPNVRLEGFIPFAKQPKYLHAADVLILPNRKDGGISEFYTSPIKLFSYMAAGRPIVASDLPSLREILNSHNAVLVPPNDPRALAEGISRALHDQDFANRIIRQALEDVQGFTWQKRAKNIIDFITASLYNQATK